MKNKFAYLFILITVLFTAIVISIGTNKDEPIEHNIFSAYRYAEGFIKESLKSPSTAVFPNRKEKSQHVKDLGFGEYQINSWVDSQNGFGAMVRSKWSCKIIFLEKKVQAENIIIE